MNRVKLISFFLLILVSTPIAYAEKQEDFYLQVSKGHIPGHRFSRRFGDLETVSTDWQDIWIPGGDYVYPSTAGLVNVSSTDIDDTAGGSGARTLFIQGLDSNYNILNETITLNGQTNVSSVNQYLRVWRCDVRLSGAHNSNEGTISITQHSILLGVIEPDDGRCQSALYTVPNGYTAYLIDMYCTSSEDKDIEYEVALMPYNQSWRTIKEINTYRESYQHKFMCPIQFNAKTEIRMRAKAGSSSGEVGAGYILLLVQDGYDTVYDETSAANNNILYVIALLIIIGIVVYGRR